MPTREATTRYRRAFVVLIALAALSAASPLAGAAGPPDQSYIVVLKDGIDSRGVAADHGARHRADVDHVYRHALKGYAARIPARELAALRSDRRVAHIEVDGEVRASATQANPTWGLDRIDARSGLDGKFTYSTTGRGVKAYIIDSGLRYTHSDFGGRARFGYDAFGGDGSDCNGHGTHVGATVGGTAYGVAKNVDLVSVRVLDCDGSGSFSGVIAAVDWVTRQKQLSAAPVVANMSLGGDVSNSVDTAVKKSIAAGVTYAIAAGNGDSNGVEQDACKSSPGRVAEAITIGATDTNDTKTSWSNYGSCVDLFAPGLGITSAWWQSDTQTSRISGTSMAAPHVAGAAALHLEANPTATAQAVRDALYGDSTKSIVKSSRTANNHLLHVAPAPVANTPPTAAFSVACAGLECTFDGSGSSDAEGPIAGYAWSLGDGSSSNAAKPAHGYRADGTYTVGLTVTDGGGATATTSRTVTIDTTAPETVIDSGPAGTIDSASASFSFSSEPGATFQCRLDGSDWAACSSPTGYSGLADGTHTFAVRATDAAGNTDATGASRTFTVDTAGEPAGAPSSVPPATPSDASAPPPPGASAPPPAASAPAAPPTPPGASAAPPPAVSINGGARYTNDRRVNVRIAWPARATRLLMSNDGGFSPFRRFPVVGAVTWTLDSAGPERLPKTVYARFEGGDGPPQGTYRDDIVLDTTAPRLRTAKVASTRGARAAAGAGSRRSYRVVLAAHDGTSGVRQVQFAYSKRRPTALARYQPRMRVKLSYSPRFVRVRDGAGNFSSWRSLRTGPRPAPAGGSR